MLADDPRASFGWWRTLVAAVLFGTLACRTASPPGAAPAGYVPSGRRLAATSGPIVPTTIRLADLPTATRLAATRAPLEQVERPESPLSEAELERLREESQRLPPSDRVQVLPASASTRHTPAGGFEALTIDHNGQASVPPDPEMAAGPNHVIVVVNTVFAIYDRTGARLAGPLPFSGLFAGVPGCQDNSLLFDPNVLYDEAADRFVIGIDGDGSAYCVAASASGDPVGEWHGYGFATGTWFFDYPHVGIGQDHVFMGGNMFNLDLHLFVGSRLWAIDKWALYEGSPLPFPKAHELGTAHFTPQPMHANGFASGTWPLDDHVILTANFEDGKSVYVWKWNGGDEGPTLTGMVDLNRASGVVGGMPFDAPQKATGNAGKLQANDWRIHDAEYRNGSIWTVQSIACNPGGGAVDCVRFAEIDPIGPTVIQSGVFASNGEHRLFPNLAINHCGDALIGYTKTGVDLFPSIFAAEHLAGDPPGQVGGEIRLRAGDQTYSAFDRSPHRWGDYTRAVSDPGGAGAWYVGEYSGIVASADARWATYVGRFDSSCSPARAILRVERPTIACADGDVGVELADRDLAGAAATTVSVRSSLEAAAESISLAAVAGVPGRFVGRLLLTAEAVVGDGRLAVAHGAELTVVAADVGSSTSLTARIAVDCAGPTLTGLVAENVTEDGLTLRWMTDEPANGRVELDDGRVIEHVDLALEHRLAVADLYSCRSHRFAISSRDAAGNAGEPATVTASTTGRAAVFGPDDVEADGSDWSVDGEGWHRTSCNSHSGTTAWKAGAFACDGNYAPNTLTRLTSAPIDLGPPGSAARLSYWERFDIESGAFGCAFDVARVLVDGGNGFVARSRRCGNSNGWRRRSLDLSDLSGPVRIRFELETDEGVELKGWLIDDIVVDRPDEAGCIVDLRLATVAIVDTCPTRPSSTDAAAVDPGETVDLWPTIENLGYADARGIEVRAAIAREGITLLQPLTAVPDLPGRWKERSLRPIRLAVAPTVACGTTIPISFTIRAGSERFAHTLTLPVGRIAEVGTPLSASFDQGLPEGWSVVDGDDDGHTWYVDSDPDPRGCASETPRAPIADRWMAVDSDCAGSVAMDEQLISPPLDLANTTAVTLAYDQDLMLFTSERAEVDVRSTKTAGAWTTIRRFLEPPIGTESVRLDLTDVAAGARDVQIRFHYAEANFAWRWFVDNIRVEAVAPPRCVVTPCPDTRAASEVAPAE